MYEQGKAITKIHCKCSFFPADFWNYFLSLNNTVSQGQKPNYIRFLNSKQKFIKGSVNNS